MTDRVQRHIAAAGLLIALGSLAACHRPAASSAVSPPTGSVTPGPSIAPPPAAAMAGGACLLMDFTTVNHDLGTTFGVSAAADSNGTYTCVIQASAAADPNLTLDVTATSLTATNFTSTIRPAGATSVARLGKIGYVEQIKASSGTGPAVEVGWLSGNERLIIMRYTFASGATAAQASAAVVGMTALARTVDVTTV